MQESQPVVLAELDQKQKAITSDIEALQKKQKVRFLISFSTTFVPSSTFLHFPSSYVSAT